MSSELILGSKVGEDTFIRAIMVNGQRKGILLPPKAIRQPPKRMPWMPGGKPIKGATSWCDGLQNTKDMAAAGSELAQWCLDRGLHLASQDELESLYRDCKPTSDPNSLWNRSGINVSAVPTTYPYTLDLPAQTVLEEFRAGQPEAFDTNDLYWSSTRHPDFECNAYAQYFKGGSQGSYNTNFTGYGCAVRWIDL